MQKIVGIGKWRARYWVHTELGGYHIFLGYEFWVFIFASSSLFLRQTNAISSSFISLIMSQENLWKLNVWPKDGSIRGSGSPSLSPRFLIDHFYWPDYCDRPSDMT